MWSIYLDNFTLEVVMKQIFIHSVSSDVHADAVSEKLLERGARVCRVDTDKFFERNTMLSSHISMDTLDCVINVNGTQYNVLETTAAWIRKPWDMVFPFDDARAAFAAQELGEHLNSSLALIDGVNWVNPRSARARADHKLVQLLVAREVGLLIPETLLSNSPGRVMEFSSLSGDELIYKTLKEQAIFEKDHYVGSVLTSRIGPEHMRHIDRIRYTSGIFQRNIKKYFELRVTVIGDQVFTARIDSQQNESARTDWRVAIMEGKVPVSSFGLSRDVEDMCLQLVRRLGLKFGAIDMIVTEDGDYVFLEINSNGQWLWVEKLTELPLADAMTDLLLGE